jgi:hypothetical protein
VKRYRFYANPSFIDAKLSQILVKYYPEGTFVNQNAKTLLKSSTSCPNISRNPSKPRYPADK